MINNRVLIIHHEGSFGGGSKSALLTGKMLRELGYQVDFCVGTNNNDFAQILGANQFNVYGYEGRMGNISNYSGGPNILSRSFIQNLFEIRKTRKFIRNIINENQYDYYIVNSSTMSWLGKSIIKGKRICFVRETKKKNFISYFQNILLNTFDLVCFISEYDVEQWNIKKCKSAVIYDCVDTNKDSKKVISKTVKEVLYLGGENEIKGWHEIKSLMSDHEEFNYHIAGYVSDENKILKENITYYQMVDDVTELYEIADVILLPNTLPHQLMPVFEAGIYKVPVITTDFTLIREHVQHNVNGLLISPNNVNELYDALIFLKMNYEKKLNLIQKNYENSKKHLYSNVKEDLFKIIKSL